MRLTSNQIQVILDTVHRQLGADAGVAVYGSRLNNETRGGDLDLLVESPSHVTKLQRAELQMALENVLQIPVDVLIYHRGTEPSAFQAIALKRAVTLEQVA